MDRDNLIVCGYRSPIGMFFGTKGNGAETPVLLYISNYRDQKQKRGKQQDYC